MTETFARRIKDDIARFIADPTREGLQNLIRYVGGEFDHYELKEAWPELPKVARTTLAIANSGGGVVIFGIRDASLEPVGLESFMAKQQVYDVFAQFIPGPLLNEITLLDFDYKDSGYSPLRGKLVQVLTIPDMPHLLPFVCEGEWTHDDAHVRRASIYVRHGTQTREVNYDQLQALLARRVGATVPDGKLDDLGVQLAQLHALYVANQRASHPECWTSTEPDASSAPDPQLSTYLADLIAQKQQDISKLRGLDTTTSG